VWLPSPKLYAGPLMVWQVVEATPERASLAEQVMLMV
jgi:hypothetical protein